jgi:arginase family enzyme
VYRRIASGPGHHYADGYLVWRNLADAGSEENFAAILAQIETDAIWLTIDKDVLAESEALTNWDQGQMPLQAMLDLIADVGARKRIIGADICGEFSPPLMSNPFKRIESRFDRPQRTADAAALTRNEEVNRKLLQAIHEACTC